MLEAPIITKIKENKKIIISISLLLLALIIMLIVVFSGGDDKAKVNTPISATSKVSQDAQEPPLWKDEDTVDTSVNTLQMQDQPLQEKPTQQETKSVEIQEGTSFQSYTVIKGDTLTKIAKDIYGSVHYWTQIFDKNKNKIKDPDRIYVGQKLLVPVRKDGNLSWDKKYLVDTYIETYKSYRKQEKLSQVYWLLLSGVKKIDPALTPYYLAEVKKFDRAFARGDIDESSFGVGVQSASPTTEY